MPGPRLIPAADAAAWADALRGLPFAAGHRRERAAVAARRLGAEAALWHWQGEHGRAACAVLLREDALGRDLTTPLGFAGFAIEGDPKGLGETWTQDWVERGACAAYVQLAPGAAAPPGLEAHARPAQDCWLWDLGLSDEGLLQGMAPKHRQLLRKWQRTSPAVVDDASEAGRALASLYADFLATTPVAPAYRFDADDIATLAAAPGAATLAVRGEDGRIEAAMLLHSAGESGESLLAASTPEGRRHSRGLYWLGAQALRARGVRDFNLGGGIRGDDALSHFKRRLGATRMPTFALRQVLDPAAYAGACARIGLSADAAGYFPPWRRPAGS